MILSVWSVLFPLPFGYSLEPHHNLKVESEPVCPNNILFEFVPSPIWINAPPVPLSIYAVISKSPVGKSQLTTSALVECTLESYFQ